MQLMPTGTGTDIYISAFLKTINQSLISNHIHFGGIQILTIIIITRFHLMLLPTAAKRLFCLPCNQGVLDIELSLFLSLVGIPCFLGFESKLSNQSTTDAHDLENHELICSGDAYVIENLYMKLSS